MAAFSIENSTQNASISMLQFAVDLPEPRVDTFPPPTFVVLTLAGKPAPAGTQIGIFQGKNLHFQGANLHFLLGNGNSKLTWVPGLVWSSSPPERTTFAPAAAINLIEIDSKAKVPHC